MTVRNFTLLCGVLFVALGVAGFIPALVSAPSVQPDGLLVNTGYGYLFGLFPTNILHNLVHLAVGILGIRASQNAKAALFYCQGFAIVYSLITVMGLVPALGTTLGLMPIFGGNVLLNLVATFAAAYYGFVAPDPDLSIGNSGVR